MAGMSMAQGQLVCESIFAAVFVKSVMPWVRETFVTQWTCRGLRSSENATAIAARSPKFFSKRSSMSLAIWVRSPASECCLFRSGMFGRM